MVKQFSSSITALALLSPEIKDEFFIKKLKIQIEKFVNDFIEFQKIKEDVASECHFAEKLILGADVLLDLVGSLEHLRLVNPNSLRLSEVHINLLTFKLNLIRTKKDFFVPVLSNIEQAESKPEAREKSDKISPKEPLRIDAKLNPNKEKILDFIKSYPRKRTKDIIFEFNALSDRTVKRNLMELLRAGLINKKVENKAAYYSASD